jgi:hypothetical protein
MKRFSVTGLAVAAVGFTLIAQGFVIQAYAKEKLIWIEPVVRDYRQMWKKKPADQNKSGGAQAAERKSGRPTDVTASIDKTKSGRPSDKAGRPADQKPKGEKKRSWGGGGHGMGRMRKANVRSGTFPQTKANLSDPDLKYTQFWLEMPDNRVMPVKLKQKGGGYNLSYPTKGGGDYRLIGYNGNHIEDGVRRHFYSFYNFMTHGDHPDEKPRDMKYRPGFHDGKPKLEMERVYNSRRGRYRSKAGQDARVRVLFKGQPVANAPVILTTSQNWQKRLMTDAQGEAAFTLIKEEFQGEVLDKRKATLYMLQTEHTEDSSGQLSGLEYNRETYAATLSFRVYPDSNEWESKRMAFLIAVFTTVVAGAAITVQRTRRRKKA